MWKLFLSWTFTVALGLIFCRPALAQSIHPETPTPTDDTQLLTAITWQPAGIELVNFIGGVPSMLATQGPALYVGADAALEVFDISAPPTPHPVTRLVFPSFIQFLTMRDGLGVVVTEQAVELLDLTNPLQPVRQGRIAVESSRLAAIGDGNRLILATRTTLGVFDITDPSRPRFLSRYEAQANITAIALHGHYLYLGLYARGDLLVLDVSAATGPTLVQTIPVEHGESPQGYFTKLVVQDDILYALYRRDLNRGEFYTIDISVPWAPEVRGSYPQSGYSDKQLDIRSFALGDNHRIYLNLYTGIQTLDASNPSMPWELGVLYTEEQGRFETMTRSGPWLFALHRDSKEIRLVTLSDSDIAGGPHETGRADLTRDVNDLLTYKDYVFAISGVCYTMEDCTSTVEVFRITNSSTPQSLNSWDTNALIRQAAIEGHFLYLPAGQEGLTVLDIQDPVHPVQVGKIMGLGIVEHVHVRDAYAYAYTRQDELIVLDVSDPQSPRKLGTLAFVGYQGVREIIADHGSVFLIRSSGGVRVVDVANKQQPVHIGQFGPNLPLLTGQVHWPYIFLEATTMGVRGSLLVYDVSDPQSPVLLSSTPLGSAVYTFALRGNYVFGADGGQLVVIDISDPKHPYKVGLEQKPPDDPDQGAVYEGATHVVLTGPFAVIPTYFQFAQGSSTARYLRVVDISDPVNALQKTAERTLPYLLSPDIQNVVGDFAYVRTNFGNDLIGLDLSDPAFPVTVPISPAISFSDSVYRGHLLYTVGAQFDIYDVSNPRSPVQVGGADIRGEHLVVHGNRAYSVLNETMHIINVDDPSFPVVVGSVTIPGRASELLSCGNRLCLLVTHYSTTNPIIRGWELTFWSISNPNQPQMVGAWRGDSPIYPLPEILAIDPYIYVFGGSGYVLSVLDISNPQHAVQISYTPGVNAVAATMADGQLVLAGDALRIYDVSAPAYPAEMARLRRTRFPSRPIAAYRNFVYLPTNSGIYVFRVPPALQWPREDIPSEGDIFAVPDTKLRYVFPPGSFPKRVTVQHRNRYIPDEQRLPIFFQPTKYVFDITAFEPQTGAAVHPLKPFTIMVDYSKAETGAVPEDTLVLYYWNETTWQRAPGANIDLDRKVVLARPNQLGLYALVGAPHQTFLPVIGN